MEINDKYHIINIIMAFFLKKDKRSKKAKKGNKRNIAYGA
jgi:hypothetical protein